MALATLSVDLVAKLAQFEGDMGKAARASEQASQRMVSALSNVTATLGGLAGGVGIAGVVAVAKAAIDSVDAFNDLRDATGASIENISALDDVAARTGTSFDTVQTALVKLNQGLNAAKPGSDVELALNAIGLSAKQLKDLDPAEALLQTAKALSNFADDGNKARLTQELFGKSLKEVAPLLKDLAEQGQLNAKVTTEQAEAAEKFNKELFNLQKNATDAARSLSVGLITSINETIETFRLGEIAGKSFYSTLVSEQLRLIGLNDGPKEYAKRLDEVTAALAKGEPRALVRNALLREQVELQKKLKALPDFSADNQSAAELARLTRKPSAQIADKPVKTPTGPKGPDQDADFQRYLTNLQKQLEKTQDLSVYEQLLVDIGQKRITLRGDQEAQLTALAKQLDLTKQLTIAQEERMKIGRQLATEAGDAVNKENEQRQARLKQLADASEGGQFKARQADLALLQEELATYNRTLGQYGISTEDYADQIKALFGLNTTELAKQKGLAEDLGLSFTSAFEDAIVGGKGLSDVLKGLEADILRIVTRKLVTEPAGDALTSLLKGAIGGGGSGGASGGVADFFSSLFGGARAGGGPVQPGRAYLVGERGPELIVPKAAGTVLPNGTGMGNVVNISVNQTFAAGTSRQTTLQAAADASRQLQLAGRNL